MSCFRAPTPPLRGYVKNCARFDLQAYLPLTPAGSGLAKGQEWIRDCKAASAGLHATPRIAQTSHYLHQRPAIAEDSERPTRPRPSCILGHSPSIMTLCKNCQSLSRVPFRPEAGWEEVYRHDARSLDAAVKAGCFICTQFRASLTAEHEAVIAGPRFEGIPCSIIRFHPDSKGPQAGSVSFTLAEQFYDCGGSTGVSNMFTILKPNGESYL